MCLEPICLLYLFCIKICNQASLMAGVCAQDSDKNEEVRRSITKSRTISDLDGRKSQNSFINLFRTNLFISYIFIYIVEWYFAGEESVSTVIDQLMMT